MVRSPYEDAPTQAPPPVDGAPPPTTKTTVVPAPNMFESWGELGKQAEDQGWYPAVPGKDNVEYRNKYNNQFNQVVIPDQKERGYISVVGSKGGRMTVFIKKADGTVDRTLLKDVSPQDVDAFFRSKIGTIQKRTDAIQAGTNSDAYTSAGTYTPLQ